MYGIVLCVLNSLHLIEVAVVAEALGACHGPGHPRYGLVLILKSLPITFVYKFPIFYFTTYLRFMIY